MRLSSIISIILSNIKIFIYKITGNKKFLIPYKILINVTDLCNSRCSFCDIWKIKPENEITIKEIDSLFKSVNRNLKWLSLSGGEVTLVKYYYELIDSAVANCKNLKIFTFTTNGLLINRTVKYALYAKEKGLDVMITISLDGDETTHDKIRGVKGNYKKCFEIFNALKSNNIKCQFGITASTNNVEFIKKKFSKYEKNIRSATFVHSGGIYNKINEKNNSIILNSMKIIYDTFKIKSIHDIVEKIHLAISLKFLKFDQKINVIPCEVLNSSAHILPNGDIKPCMFMNKIGNIKHNDFSKVLQSTSTLKIRNDIKKNNCPKCWMNCYSVHSIMQHPIKSFTKLLF